MVDYNLTEQFTEMSLEDLKYLSICIDNIIERKKIIASEEMSKYNVGDVYMYDSEDDDIYINVITDVNDYFSITYKTYIFSETHVQPSNIYTRSVRAFDNYKKIDIDETFIEVIYDTYCSKKNDAAKEAYNNVLKVFKK